MSVWAVVNARTGKVIATAREARSFGQRLLGLMFRSGLPPGEGLWIRPCNAIHTMFMRFAIDAVYLNDEGRVVRVDRNVRPWRVARPCPGARSVLELTAGGAQEICPGERLIFSAPNTYNPP